MGVGPSPIAQWRAQSLAQIHAQGVPITIFADLGVELRWVPEFIRDSGAHYYLVVPFLEYAELYGRLQEIMKSEGYRYVYAEKSTLYFERDKMETIVCVHAFDSQSNGELLPQIAKQNGLEYNGAEEIQIVALLIRKRPLIWE